MSKVYVVEAKRSAIGSFLGSLAAVHPSDLGGQLVAKVLERADIEAGDIDEVIMGNVLPAGQGQGLARQVSIKGGLSKEIPAYGVNMVCGSGMKALMNAYAGIKSGFSNLVLTGGVESMSSAPFITPASLRLGNKLGDLSNQDDILLDGLTDAFNHYHIGVTAENIARKYNISRQEQDAFAFKSQRKAIEAVDSGRFKEEILPTEVKTRRETVIFDRDEYPNRKTNLEKLAKLRPVFEKDGTVTAGNASGINDGASVIVLASEKYVKSHKVKALAEVVAIGQGGVDPSVMGLGPVPAVRDVLTRSGMTFQEMELIELNEAFAAQSIGVISELAKTYGGTKDEILAKTNVNGGAIALGHPLGASGSRIIVTLIHELKKRDLSYGLASLCIGGGMGTAVIIKNL